MYSTLWLTKKVPEKWAHTKLVAIWKGAEKQISDQQQGFLTGRGTTDGIFILKRVQQIADRTNQHYEYALFIDLTAAFDNIDMKWLFQSIRRVPPGANIQLFQLIESVYDYTMTSLPDDNEEIFEIISLLL